MGAWNLKEFKTLCLDSGFDKAWFYTESLAFKWNAAIYHKGKIRQKIDEISSKSLQKVPVYDLEIAFELDALMTALNSIWDILAQLLNECFVQPKIDIDKVYFEAICKDYRAFIPTEIQSILDRVRRSHLYATLKAYATVSKHRHAIYGEIQVILSEPPEVSYEIEEFEYKGVQKRKLTPDRAFKCLQFVGQSLDQIGVKIQELVKSRNHPPSM